MAYYCLLVPAYTGHLNPMAVLGRELQRRGHRVAVVAPCDARAKVQAAGLDFIPVATVEFPEGEWERRAARMGELSGLKAGRFVGHWLGRFARGILRDLPAIAARERFDGVVMDQISLGTESVCAALGLRLAVACCALTLHAESGVPPLGFSWRCRTSPAYRLRNLLGLLVTYSTGWPVTGELLRFRFRHRLPRMPFQYMNELPPSLVQVAQQPAFFDFPRRHLPDHFHYTGPWKERGDGAEGGFPWDRLDGRPLVYASMGTLQNRLARVFRIMAEACAGLEVQLVLALGRPGAPTPMDLPGQPIVVDYAPQARLLRRAALVITHGGLNTTLDSLSEGLPLVVVPVANDQPGIAARVAHLGVGQFIPVRKLTATGLREAVAQVLARPGYRERSASFAEELRRTDGPGCAAGLIEAAFATGQRMVRSGPRLPAPR
jgi:zeaxanthin glucosyltransferase